jgi:hypothetical protein
MEKTNVSNHFGNDENNLLWAEWLVSSGEDKHKKPPLELTAEEKTEWWIKLSQNARTPKISEIPLFTQILTYPPSSIRKYMRIYFLSNEGGLAEFLDFLGIAFEKEKSKPAEDIVL